MREYIISKGGQVLFNTQAKDFESEDGKIKAVICENNKIETDAVILAIGHSARDTFKRLYEIGVEIQPKNFAVGTRIEHLQEDINKAQYSETTKLKLPSADYKLVYHASNGRTCYTFCMCPGGKVMASNSEESSIVTNGMSNFARDGENANSALLVNISIEDFYKESPLDGMYFQEELEKKAFELIHDCAIQGHLPAIYDLGANFYYNGVGTDRNLKLSEYYLKMAVNAGLPRAKLKFEQYRNIYESELEK